MQCYQILQNLVKIDSNCDISNKRIVDYIKEIFQNKGLAKVYKFKKGSLDQYNLVIKIKGKSKNNPLIFISHTDTVRAGDNWRTNPFDLIEQNNKFYGLGTSDTKGAIAALISACLRINEIPQNDVYLIFDADEEGLGLGGKQLIENINFSNASVVIMEPTENKIQIFQKACLGLKIYIKGKAQHSSTTSYQNNVNNNAIYKANNIIHYLLQYEKKVLDQRYDRLFGKSTQNIGLIKGGVAGNIVAEECLIEIDRRLLPNENLDVEFEAMKKIIIYACPNALIKKTFHGEAFSLDKKSKIISTIKNIYKKIDLQYENVFNPFWTEAGIFKKWGNCVVISPGTPSCIHQPNEYIKKGNLEKFEKICYLLTKNGK